MSDSNRGLYIVATLAGIILLGTIGSAESRCEREQNAYQAKTARQPGSNEIIQFRSARSGVPCLVERAIANPETGKTTEHDQRDLVAQEGSALWAFWIAAITFLQLVLSAFGLWAILRTLKQGQEAVQASRDSVRETRRIGEAQTRCYLSVIEATVTLNRRVPVIRVKVKNSGQSPARKVRAEYAFNPDAESDVLAGITATQHDAEEDISGQDVAALPAWHPPNVLTPEQVKMWTEPSSTVVALKVTISAIDVFGEPVKEQAWFLWAPNAAKEGVAYVMDPFNAAKALAQAQLAQIDMEGI